MKVFVTRKIPETGLKLLKKHHQVRIYPKDQIIPKKELIKGVKWCDALLCLLTDNIDQEVINVNPNLKIIANYAVGYNNIDINYAKKKGIPVTNTPSSYISDGVTEHTFALMLTLAKRIMEADKFVKQNKYKGWSPTLLMGSALKGKTIGIVGLGAIGLSVAERAAHCMGMNVLYHDIKKNKSFERKYKAKFSSVKTILKKADFVTLHVPLLPSTRHLIGKKELKLMKKTAFLINTARGAVIDEKALVKALKKKQIAGAAIDVYEFEPKLSKGLTKLNNVILTPHIASATHKARSEMALVAAKNILMALQGKKPTQKVN